MKFHLRQLLYILIIICLFISCQKDDGSSSTQFSIDASEVRNLSNNVFLMATSPSTGEIFHSDVGLNFADNIRFDTDGNETVDLTYGYEYSSGFTITTYRDVRSGFKLSGFTFFCNEDEARFDTLYNKNFEIIISGTKEIVEIINPLFRTFNLDIDTSSNVVIEDNIIYDYDNDLTRIVGRPRDSYVDQQLVFLFEGEQEYKCVTIREEDWTTTDNESYSFKTQINELANCKQYTIDLGVEGEWIVNAEVLTDNGARRIISLWSNYVQTQRGTMINLYLEEGLEIENLKLEVKRSNILDGFHYQNNFDKMPSSLTFKEYDLNITAFSAEAFEISISDSYHLIESNYSYENENIISTWNIYQSSNSVLSYNLPTIDSGFLSETSLMKESLPNPDNLVVKTYSVDVENFDEDYNKTGIERQLPCLGFSSSYISF